MPWHTPLTDDEKRTRQQAFDKIFKRFGSYNKVALALQVLTGEYISHESIRLWMLGRYIPPVRWAASMSDLVPSVELSDFYPWLAVYFERRY